MVVPVLWMSSWAEGAKYTGLGFSIIAFAIVGYYVGRTFDQEILGLLLGVLFGTAYVYAYAFYEAGVFGSRRRKREG